MKLRTFLTTLILTAISCGFSGCGGKPEPEPTSQVSVGQQLNDLETARQKGIITDREYKRLKKALIKRYD